MRHVSPERWAAVCARRVREPELARLIAHADNCERCRRDRDRVAAAQISMADLRNTEAPELGWDAIRAKVRWELSPAGRSSHRDRTPWIVGVAIAVAASVAVFAVHSRGSSAVAPTTALSKDPIEANVAEPSKAHTVAVEPLHRPAVPPLLALVTRARGTVQIDGDAARLFDRSIGVGAVLATGEGRLDVQFGEGSGLLLGDRSTLRLERFDLASVEVTIDGVVDIAVASRAAGQRFLVRAGAQIVEVRGTQFRVDHRADRTRVSCLHGIVTVREGARSIDVAAGQWVDVHTGQDMPAPLLLAERERVELALAAPYRLPWPSDDAKVVATTTTRLDLVAEKDRLLRLDGVELGAGSTSVRVLRGRHLVETSHHRGRFRRAGWVVVSGSTSAAHFDASADEPSASRRQRLADLRALLDRGKLGRCVRSIAKQGLSGTFVGIELSVDRNGAIGYLNITDTDLPAELAECVRGVVAETRFAPGAAATVIEHLEL